MQPLERVFLTGGAGFIGSHFVDALLRDGAVRAVTIYDNFSSGQSWHYAHHGGDPRLHVVRAGIEDFNTLRTAMKGHNVVIHLASNPDIARAVTEPSVDFTQGTCLTNNVLEAMRLTGTTRILYASGSGVYGDLGHQEAREDHGPLLPVSTYGASKLAGEALISAYCSMFGLSGVAFRFANVVGPRQTHGVGFDFLRSLARDPARLTILGDGSQSKSYIHVEDVIAAVLLAHGRSTVPFLVFNVGTGDYLTVREIAGLAVECAGLDPRRVEFNYTGGDRGWKGDVPIVRLNCDRIRSLGWQCRRSSLQAMRDALASMRAARHETVSAGGSHV